MTTLDRLSSELSALLRQLDRRGPDHQPTLAAIDDVAAELHAERLGNGDAHRAARAQRIERALSPAGLLDALKRRPTTGG